MKKVIVFLACAIFCLSFIASTAQSATPNFRIISSSGVINKGVSLGWLHTDGRWIKNMANQTVNLLGCAEAQTSWQVDTSHDWNHDSDPLSMARRMSELGVTWVRICVSYTYWSDPIDGPPYRYLIDRYVVELTLRGIYVTVGCMGHEFGDQLTNGNTTNWINFLSELANRYKENPGMCGIYIFNEWQFVVPLDKCHVYAVQAAQALNAINPNLLILVHGDLLHRQGIDPYWISNPIPVPNVVYVYHDYFWQHYYYDKRDFALSYEAGNYTVAKQQMEAYFYDKIFKYAVEYNMCIMNEEFGFSDDPSLTPADKGYTPGFPQCMHDYLEMLNKYSIPWNEYCWWAGGYSLADDGVNLNSVGLIWHDYLVVG